MHFGHFRTSTLALLSTATVCAVTLYWYGVFHEHDWGQPVAKLFAFTALAALTTWLLRSQSAPSNTPVPETLLRLEAVALLGLLGSLLGQYLYAYWGHVFHGPWVDIGYTTQNAARMLFLEGDNPYASTELNPRDELADKHRGYHYGPAMLLAYIASAIWPAGGFKLTSLVALGLLLAAQWVYLGRHAKTQGFNSERLVAFLFVAIVSLGAERFWYELLRQGANDILPISLVVLGLALHQRQQFFVAGLALGLSFASKFAPAFVFIALLLHWRMPKLLLAGLIAGASPIAVFAAWDFTALFENVFVLRAQLRFDSTSLYSVTPEALHGLFAALPLGALAVAVFAGLRKTPSTHQILLRGLLVLLCFEVTFKEMHTNHLMWFYPLFALAIADMRHRLFSANIRSTSTLTASEAPTNRLWIWLLLGWLAFIAGVTWGVGPEPGWVADWRRWDGHWYQSIWENGYAAAEHTIAFPPIFSVLAGSLSKLSPLSFAESALVINLCALAAAGRALGQIYQYRFGQPQGPAQLFLLSFPALYFALAPYSDTIFLFVSLQIIALISSPQPLSRSEHVALLMLLFCAPLIRITGVVFAGLLIFGYWQAIAAVAGVAVWLQINHTLGGSALAFIEVQSQFLMPDGGLFQGLKGAWAGLIHGTDVRGWVSWTQLHLIPIVTLLLIGNTLLWLARRRDFVLLYLLLAITLISHSQSFWRSVVRYDMPLWPFLAAPLLAVVAQPGSSPIQKRLAMTTLIAIGLTSLAFQALYAHLFVRGGWTF